MNLESVIRYCYDYNIFIYGMIFFCVVGVVIKFSLLGSYHRLKKSLLEAERKSNNLILKISIKLKQAMKTQKKSFQVDAFVNKYVDERKSCGLLLSTWESICGQMSSLCLLIASCAGFLGLIYHCEQSRILLTFLTGAWTAILVNIVNNIVNIKRLKKEVILSLTHYVNNALFEEGIQVPGFYRNPLDEWKRGIPKTRKVLRQQERLNLLKEEVECQKHILAKEITESINREREVLLKKEQKAKKKEDRLKKAEAKRQRALEEKQAREVQEIEDLKKPEHVSLKERRRTRAIIKKQISLEKKKVKSERQEQKISARLKNEQEKEARRIARQEEKAKVGQEKKSRAYEEKMRLKREKERAEVIRQQEAAKNNVELLKPEKETVSIVQEEKEPVHEEPLVSSFDEPEESSDYEADYEDGAKEVKDQAATSQEDEVLLEEVLKDFFQ